MKLQKQNITVLNIIQRSLLTFTEQYNPTNRDESEKVIKYSIATKLLKTTRHIHVCFQKKKPVDMLRNYVDK